MKSDESFHCKSVPNSLAVSRQHLSGNRNSEAKFSISNVLDIRFGFGRLSDHWHETGRLTGRLFLYANQQHNYPFILTSGSTTKPLKGK